VRAFVRSGAGDSGSV